MFYQIHTYSNNNNNDNNNDFISIAPELMTTYNSTKQILLTLPLKGAFGVNNLKL